MHKIGLIYAALIIAVVTSSGCDGADNSDTVIFGGSPTQRLTDGSSVTGSDPLSDMGVGRVTMTDGSVGGASREPERPDMASEGDAAVSDHRDVAPGQSLGDGPMDGLAESTGFSTRALRWSVPESGSDDGFFTAWYGANTRWFATMDLTGDGVADLIQTGDISRDNGFVWTDGHGSFWKVWPGHGEGFSEEYLRWSVPDSGQSDGFFFTSWSNGTRWFSTRDLNGDGRPDLIQTADPSRSGGYVWRDERGSYWRVWLGRDGGFAPDYLRWAVPESGLDDGFFSLYWSDGPRWHSTIDLTGDGRPDLVQTADPHRDGGYVFNDDQGAYWVVWAGVEGGFSAQHVRWPVPSSGLSDGFFAASWTQGERSFATIDITGDGLLDLVQSADSERRGGYVWRDSLGPFWKVFPGDGGGFAADAVRWSVPESGLGDGFFALWWTQGERGFATIDLTGDQVPDLVQTANPGRSGGFVWRDEVGAYWLV